jgi:GNAT superfamily N-acetyltransferase
VTPPFPHLIRSAEERDTSFLIGCWLEGWKSAAPKGTWRHSLRWPRYRVQQTAIIKAILARGVAVVACVPEDSDHLLGFAVGEGTCLHYVHVRPERRRLGLGRLLAEGLELPLAEASHMTPAGERLANNMGLWFNPLSAMVV